jgi:hypothetical protein
LDADEDAPAVTAKECFSGVIVSREARLDLRTVSLHEVRVARLPNRLRIAEMARRDAATLAVQSSL